MDYKVEQRGKHYYVMGLKPEYGTQRDTMLLYHHTADESETPEVDAPRNADKMHGALYDLFQCHDGLKSGDTFETPFGKFECQGVQVVPMFDMTVA